MTAKTYRAVVEHDSSPKTLTVIATGNQQHCAGAVAAWRSFNVTGNGAVSGDRALIVVEVAE